jgi:hypothetical protein
MSNRVTMKAVEEVLEEKFFPVSYSLSTAVNINNSGTLNESMLEKAKRAFIMETIGVWKDDLVQTKQGYPVGDVSEVQFDIDVVILKREDFELIKKYHEQLFETGGENFPDKA